MCKSNKFALFFTPLGAAMIIFGYAMQYLGENDMLLGYCTGAGLTFIVIGIINFAAARRRTPEKEKMLTIEERDERNIRIREKSALIAYFTTMAGIVAVQITFLILRLLVPSMIMLGLLFLHAGSFLFGMRIYGRKI